jgi:hypothetical protein
MCQQTNLGLARPNCVYTVVVVRIAVQSELEAPNLIALEMLANVLVWKVCALANVLVLIRAQI